MLDGTTIHENLDIKPSVFYSLLAGTGSLPATSQHWAGALAETA
jgi:hypothetical protein